MEPTIEDVLLSELGHMWEILEDGSILNNGVELSAIAIEELYIKLNTLKLEFLFGEFVKAIESTLDSKAKEYKFNSILSARSYAGYDNPFREVAIALGQWATSCWVKAEELKTQALESNTMPTAEEVLSQMPEFSYVG